MKRVIENDYQTYRRWFERALDLVWQMPAQLRAKTDPMAELAKAEAVSRKRAITSLYAGMRDTIAITDRYSAGELQSLDERFQEESLPSMTSVRTVFDRTIGKILDRGVIASEDEFYSLKSLEDCTLSDDVRSEVQRLLGDYELRRLGE